MNRLPRLVATDLDGTLVRDDGSVSERTREVLGAVIARGVPVVIATARPLRWLDDLWPLVAGSGVGAMGVVSNGAIWWDTGRVGGDRARHLAGLDAVAGLALCERILAACPEATFAIETLAGLRLGPGFNDPYPHPEDTPRGELVDLWDGPAVKLMVRAAEPVPAEQWPGLRDRLVAAVGTAGEATWSGAGLLEISAPGVTKASTLALICAELDIPAAEVVAFGDMPNDLPMLQWAGTSYAMANADPAVLAAADRVAPSNQADGVATVLAGIFSIP